MSYGEALLEVRHLAKRYGDTHALCDVDFEVRSGEIVGVIGPNGAGKTTLLECLVGLQAADAGEVHRSGAPLPVRRRRDAMFYLPDGILPWEEQPVWRITGLFREMYRLDPAHEAAAVTQLELAQVLGKRVGELSKGYRRRMLLALGLLTPQPILMMDEPFDGFDLRQTLRVMDLMREIAHQRTILLSIHQLRDAERMCDRLLLLQAGRRLGFGTLAELAAQAGTRGDDLEEVFLGLTA